jgi:uncharacterized protein involved in propanediol utilization
MEKKFFYLDKTHYGEILQGIYPNYSLKNRCVVTLPIKLNNKLINDNDDFIEYKNLYNYIEFCKNNKLKIQKIKYAKAFKLIKNFEKIYKKKIKGSFNFCSNIQREKGLGSSTVDLLTVIKVLASIKKLNISKKISYKLCCMIEATDPLLEKNLTIFSTITGRILHQSKIKYPQVKIFSFDLEYFGQPGMKTDEVVTPKYTKKELNFFTKSFNTIKKMKFFDFNKIRNISIGSLIINQKYYPKKNFDKIILLSKKIKNSFLVGAHSGTLIGIAIKKKHQLTANEIKIIKLISKITKSPISKYESYS